ncbi:phosphotransferase [Nocardiopsis rhodophaea]|uniref:phosphotransferase n=1 Tax=Nocardiopsis rhodophaea TaxID=280238 RepID=UPI0031D12D4C
MTTIVSPVPGVATAPGIGPQQIDIGGAEGLARVLQARGERLDGYATLHVNAGRNLVVRLQRADGSGIVVKQHREREDDRYRIERMANRCWMLSGWDMGRGAFAPRLLDEWGDQRILVFELVPAARSLADLQQADGELPEEALAAAGSFTGALHALARESVPEEILERTSIEDDRRQMVSYWGMDTSGFAVLSPAEIRLAAAVQRDPLLRTRLADLSDSLVPAAVVHGDLRPENILRSGRRPGGVAVIDWELCRWSDPAAEVGHLVGNLLFHVLCSVRAERRDVTAWRSAAEKAVGAAAHGLGKLWRSYTEQAGSLVSRREGFPSLVAGHTGAALLGRIAGMLRSVDEISPRDLLITGIARDLVVNPGKAVGRLFGSPAGTVAEER